LAACLQREVAARDAHGGEGRIRAARFPARKSIEEFDFDHARGLKRDQVMHLATLDFVAGKENVIFLGPPGTDKTHLAIGLGIRGCQAGHRALFATASQWVDRLADAHNSGRLQAELARLGRYPLLVVDEVVGYIRFEPEAANLFFQLVSSRYERASLIVTSNQPFGRRGEVFGDEVAAAAMIDRLVHHAEVVSLCGGLPLAGQRPACGGPHRQYGGGLLQASSRRVAQPGAGLQKLSQRQRPEPLAKPVRGAVTRACRAEIARVRNVIACARVASSTRIASRSPRRRGSLRSTPASACRAARTASISSLFTLPRRAGRWGRSPSTIRSQHACSAVVSPAPKLPVPSMAHVVASWRRPKPISWG
jgi:DNA replication protein DnaC